MPTVVVEEILHAKLAPESIIRASLDSDILVTGVIDRNASIDYYAGEYAIEPKAEENIVLSTKMKMLSDDVTVLKVPYFETSNIYGDTAYIASEV